MIIPYEERKFSRKNEALIEHIKESLAYFDESGESSVILRTLYYDLVKQNIIPNTDQSYDRLGTLVTNARMAGRISWKAIEDTDRDMGEPYDTWSANDVLSNAADMVYFNRWKPEGHPKLWQRYMVYIAVEKKGQVKTFKRAADPYGVPVIGCKGYPSATLLWEWGRAMRDHINDGITPLVLHFGDHDPSGLDMTKDLRKRLSLFAETDIRVKRMGLNIDQVRSLGLPPNPAKVKDSRAPEYIKKFGHESWEMEGVSIVQRQKITEDSILEYLDMNKFMKVKQIEKEQKGVIESVIR